MEATKTVEQLRCYAQKLANDWHEPCLIVLDPPASPIHGQTATIPYCVVESMATKQEKAVAVQTIYPTN